MFRSLCFRFSLAFLMGCCSCSAVFADLIHPDVMGDTVWFTAISEGSPTGDPLPLYGTPSVIDNELTFPTTGNFAATSEAGSGPDQTDGKLTFMVTAKPGNFLQGIGFSELGLTSLKAPFGGDAFTSVDAFAVIDINAIDGVPYVGPSITEFFDFVPSNEFLFSEDADGPTFASGWRGTADVRFERRVTKITVTLNNVLFAATTSDDGTAALIDKKEFRVRVPTEVPEPTTMVLGVVFGLFSLGGASWFRANS